MGASGGKKRTHDKNKKAFLKPKGRIVVAFHRAPWTLPPHPPASWLSQRTEEWIVTEVLSKKGPLENASSSVFL